MEVINKIDEVYWEYCTPSWFHLQAICLIMGRVCHVTCCCVTFVILSGEAI